MSAYANKQVALRHLSCDQLQHYKNGKIARMRYQALVFCVGASPTIRIREFDVKKGKNNVQYI